MPSSVTPPNTRFGTNSIKWEYHVDDGGLAPWRATDPLLGAEQILPMWVADMDFQASEPIRRVLGQRLNQGVFGYATKSDSYLAAITSWFARRNNWTIHPDCIVPTPGVVPGMHVALRQFTVPGDKVLIQRPVYHPFSSAVENNNRILVNNGLVLKDGRYYMDLEDLESKASDSAAKLAILCSPHNPVSRVWSREELTGFAEICERHKLIVIVDEIHSDLILPGNTFFTYGRLPKSLKRNAIICTAPSKTFNLAGLMTANFIVENETLRERLLAELRACGLYTMNPFGIAATEAAYNESEQWLDEIIDYIFQNFKILEEFLLTNLPKIKLIDAEGTYLAWLDCRALQLTEETLYKKMLEEAKIYMNEGRVFGPEGIGFMRMNLACHRDTLETALMRLKRVFGDLI